MKTHHTKQIMGVEFWLARDLQQLLGYDTWRSFFNAISKAKTACELSEQKVSDHFADVSKMIELPKNAEREIDDIMLTSLCLLSDCSKWRPKKTRNCFCANLFCITNQKSRNHRTKNTGIRASSSKKQT